MIRPSFDNNATRGTLDGFLRVLKTIRNPSMTPKRSHKANSDPGPCPRCDRPGRILPGHRVSARFPIDLDGCKVPVCIDCRTEVKAAQIRPCDRCGNPGGKRNFGCAYPWRKKLERPDGTFEEICEACNRTRNKAARRVAFTQADPNSDPFERRRQAQEAIEKRINAAAASVFLESLNDRVKPPPKPKLRAWDRLTPAQATRKIRVCFRKRITRPLLSHHYPVRLPKPKITPESLQCLA